MRRWTSRRGPARNLVAGRFWTEQQAPLQRAEDAQCRKI